MKGQVIRSTGSFYTIKSEEGHTIECRLKGKLRQDGSKHTNILAVGDHVIFELEADNHEKGVISAIEPRRNHFVRRSTNLSKQSHVIAANIDRAFLFATLSHPRTSLGFIDRFLVTAEAYGIPVSIIFNKIDLLDEQEMETLKEIQNIYAPHYTVNLISVKDKIGTDDLQRQFIGSTSLISGHSGTGKSTFINYLNNKLALKTGDLSEAHQKGVHTTTFSQLYELENGGIVIDTPGIKELGMFALKKQDLPHYFPEMKALLNTCRFDSCLHLSEPSCNVKKAVAEGLIASSRYNTYLNIMTSNELDEKFQ